MTRGTFSSSKGKQTYSQANSSAMISASSSPCNALRYKYITTDLTIQYKNITAEPNAVFATTTGTATSPLTSRRLNSQKTNPKAAAKKRGPFHASDPMGTPDYGYDTPICVKATSNHGPLFSSEIAGR